MKKVNKSELKRKCQEILNNRPLNQPLDDEDAQFLISVFKGHNHWLEKEGCGVRNITIEKNKDNFNTKGFYLYRFDGSKIDISYIVSINNRDELTDIRIACRTAINDEIEKVKNSVKYGIDKCIFTGEVLTKENTHIDHYDLTFQELFDKWIENKDIKNIFNAVLNNTEAISTQTFFIDEKIKNDFILFHNQNTHLRAISKYANTSILRKKDEPQMDLQEILKNISVVW